MLHYWGAKFKDKRWSSMIPDPERDIENRYTLFLRVRISLHLSIEHWIACSFMNIKLGFLWSFICACALKMGKNTMPFKVIVQFRDMWGDHGVQIKHIVSTVLTEKIKALTFRLNRWRSQQLHLTSQLVTEYNCIH